MEATGGRPKTCNDMNQHLKRFMVAGALAAATTQAKSHYPPAQAATVAQRPVVSVSRTVPVAVASPAAEEGVITAEADPPSPVPVVVIHNRAAYNLENETLAQSLAAKRGWVGGQWQALKALLSHESGFDDRVINPSSGAAGIGQNINGLAGYPDPSPAGQITWTLDYIARRYGNPENAWYFWESISPSRPPYNGHWY